MTLNEAKWLTLVLGGVRAGKSSYAQGLAALGGRVLFLATAEAGDEEMTARIEAHREDRPAGWDTLEEPSWARWSRCFTATTRSCSIA